MIRSLAERASFRDAAGRVFERDGVLLRRINPMFEATFRAVERSGLLDELQRGNLLIPHKELTGNASGEVVIQPERIPFITYPYEWTPCQLRDAALLTLELADRALRRGFVLRDASAYNIQLRNGRPILIDSLSFALRERDSPWMAYGQFCRHFLGPLALASLVDPELLRLSCNYADGIPIRLASRTLGWRGLLNVGVGVHLHVHALAERRAAKRPPSSSPADVPDRRLAQTIDGLRSTIDQLPIKAPATAWLGYAGGAHYDAASRAEKDSFISGAIDDVRPRHLWDLGSNSGDLALRHVPANGYALALDADLGCAEMCYARAKTAGASVVTVWGDLLAPSPASGWANEERASLADRGPADMVLALAVIHHLSIGGRVPLDRVASWLGRIANHAVVEIPSRDDPMVALLVKSRNGNAADFGPDEFRLAVGQHFEIVRETVLTGLPRTLFFLRRRSS